MAYTICFHLPHFRLSSFVVGGAVSKRSYSVDSVGEAATGMPSAHARHAPDVVFSNKAWPRDCWAYAAVPLNAFGRAFGVPSPFLPN
jgi:hypothetical protein